MGLRVIRRCKSAALLGFLGMLIAGAALSDVLATNTGYYVSGDKKFSVECSLVGAGALRYPPKARKYKYVGQVVVAFSIGTDGKVVDPHILDLSLIHI